MSAVPPLHHRLAAQARHALGRLRPGHWVALSAVLVAAFGLLGLRSVTLPGPRPVDPRDRLRIEVVQPVEPRITPGTVMDVGELVDGFRYVAPAAVTQAAYYEPWDEEHGAPPPPSRERYREEAVLYPPPQPPAPEPPRRHWSDSRWFGFDAPRPDYQAERERRRAYREAQERMRDERQEARRRYEDERAWRTRQADDRERWRDAPPPGDGWD